MDITQKAIEEFARKQGLPKQGLLDYLSRLDELLIANLKVMSALDRTIKITVPPVRSIDSVELRKKVESGAWMPYEVKTLSLTNVRTNEPLKVQGDFIHAWTDGELDGIGVRLNKTDAGLLYFKRRNPIKGVPFWELYLTNTAQAGKALDLMIGREAAAEAQTAEVTVSLSQKFHTLRSDKDTHFTGAIAQNAMEDENLTGLLSNKMRITGINLQADENLDFRVIFWKTDGFENADLDLDRFCGEVQVDLPTNGYRIAGANQYYLDVRGLDIDYEDEDASNELHVSLMCLSAAGKTAGGGGEVVLEVFYEPRA